MKNHYNNNDDNNNKNYKNHNDNDNNDNIDNIDTNNDKNENNENNDNNELMFPGLNLGTAALDVVLNITSSFVNSIARYDSILYIRN